MSEGLDHKCPRFPLISEALAGVAKTMTCYLRGGIVDMGQLGGEMGKNCEIDRTQHRSVEMRDEEPNTSIYQPQTDRSYRV